MSRFCYRRRRAVRTLITVLGVLGSAKLVANLVANRQHKLMASQRRPRHVRTSSGGSYEQWARLSPLGDGDQQKISPAAVQRLQTQILLVYGSTVYGEVKRAPDVTLKCPPLLHSKSFGGDELEVTTSYNMTHASQADGVIYYGPDTTRGGSPFFSQDRNYGHEERRPGEFVDVRLLNQEQPRANTRVNVYYTEEPPFSSGYTINEGRLCEHNATAMRHFQVFAGFNPTQLAGRDGQICYAGWGLSKYSGPEFGKRGRYWSEEVVPFASRRTDFDSVWVQSNCADGDREHPTGHSRRKELVEVLMQTGRVAAMGPCLHNVDFLGSLASSTGFGNLKATEQDVSLRKFKFALAFENSLCGSYMSEKIWKAYALGVVPVVYASREAAAVLPSSDSFINARDFSSAVQLREHLAEVANDEPLYNKYFDWKKRPLSKLNPGFQDLWSRFSNNSTTEFQCCIARGVARALEDFRSNVVPPPLPFVGCDTVNQDQYLYPDWSTFLHHKAGRVWRWVSKMFGR
jgi:hypothetical protein